MEMKTKYFAEEGPRAPAIGIDLGTTYSCVAVWERDRPKIIVNDRGNRTTPSYVSFTDEGILVGDAAQDNAAIDPSNSIYAVKRLMGRRFSDPCVQKDNNLRPFTVVSNADDKPKIVVQYRGKEKEFSAEEISAMILEKMKQTAENYLGCIVNDAVITVPAYFSDSQRRATKEAGILAGLNVKRIMDEPTAAALAYGFDKIKNYNNPFFSKLNFFFSKNNNPKPQKPQNVCVFDLGGGTFDVSVVNVSSNHFEVKATAGDTHLGGEDFNNRILIYCLQEFKRKYNEDIKDNAQALRRLRCACERAKRSLSAATMTTIQIDYLYQDLDFSYKLSRNQFDELNKDLFAKCIELTERCLNDAKVDKSDVDIVVLSGGSTRIPKVQKLVEEYFGDKKKVHKNINPDEAVAYGAAIQAAKLSGQGSDVINNIVLTDVTPLSLGIEVRGGVMSIIIPRNTPIPTKKVNTYVTGGDYATTMPFSVYEGERPRVSDNHHLGEFEVPGISPAPRGEVAADVCFEIDADGILNISAIIQGSGQMSKLKIINEESWLRNETIDEIIKDAEKSKTEDVENRRKCDGWNELNWYTINTRRTMRKQELVSLTSERERKKIEDKICETFIWLDFNENPLASVEAFRSKLCEIKEICEPIIAKMK